MLLFLRSKGKIASIVIIGIVITSMLVFTIPNVKADSSIIFSDDFTNGSFDAWTSTTGNTTITGGTAIFSVIGGEGASCYAEKNMLPINSNEVFSVSSIVSFNTIPTNGYGNAAILFNEIVDSIASQNALVYAFLDGSGHFGLWLGQYPNNILSWDNTLVSTDNHYNVTIQLDNPNQQAKLIVNGTTTITHTYTAYSQFQNSNTVNILEGIPSNWYLANVTVKTNNVAVTASWTPPPTPSPTPTLGSNIMYSFPVQMTMIITKTEETTISIPIQATWIANDGTVYAGSSQTLYKSQDSGITWHPLISFNSSMPEIINCVFVNKMNFVFIAPGTGVNVDELGLWRSTNNGQDWSKVLSLPDSCTIISMDEDSNGNLFAGVYTTGSIANATILKSIDGGAHWQTFYYNSSARHVHCVAVDKANNYIYASIGDLRVSPDWVGYTVRSTNGGNDWTRIKDVPQMLAILPVDAKTENGKLTPVARLFITDYDSGQIYRTTDDVTFDCVYDIGAQSYGFWMRQDDINGDIYASMVAGEGAYKKAEIDISHDKGETWNTYKSFNVNAPYLGSSTASNFLQGTMYYATQLDSGWQNGIQIYTSYGNTANYSLHTDSLRQVSLNSPDWLSNMIAVLLLTALTASFVKKRKSALYALKRR